MTMHTPIQARFHQAHLDRLARIEGRVYRPVPAAPVAVTPEPEPVVAPREPWFRIVGLEAPTIRDVQEIVGEFYGFSIVDLRSVRRDFPLARVRQIAMYLAKTVTEKTLPEIGRRFGGRDHTTAMHAVRRIKSLMLVDRELSDEVEELKLRLEAL